MEPFQFDNFPFNKVKLSNPQSMQGGGSYFTKLTINDSAISLQFPVSKTKAGIISTKKHTYIDLLYPYDPTSLIHGWLESLEETCKNLLDEKKALWFINDLTKSDIESMINPTSRIYKNGKFILLRMTLNTTKKSNNEIDYQLFNENQCKINSDQLSNEHEIIPLVILDGIKFTARSIDIEFKVSQIMMLNKIENDTCLIKPTKPATPLSLDNKINLFDLVSEGKTSDDESINESNKDNLGIIDEKTDNIDNIDNLETDKLDTNKLEANIEETNKLDTDKLEFGKTDNVDNLETGETTSFSNNLEKDDNLQNIKTDVKTELENNSANIKENDIFKTEAIGKDENMLIEVLDNFDINTIQDKDSVSLRNPDEIYYEIYKDARKKAKQIKAAAINAYLEAKHIKDKYMLEDIEDSDEEEDFKENFDLNITD